MVATVFIAKLDRDLRITLAATAVRRGGVGLWFAALLLLLASKPGVAGEQPQPTPNLSLAGFRELAEAREIGQETLSPGGRHATFVVTTPDVKSNSSRRDLYLAATDGSRTVRVETPVGSSPASVKWLPDGRRFTVLLSVQGVAQVHLGRADTGSVRPLTSVAGGVDDYALSPDGQRVALIAAGPSGRQVRLLEPLVGGVPVALTGALASPASLRWHPDGRRLFFVRADDASGDPSPVPPPAVVRWQDPPLAPRHLWSVDVVTKHQHRWTEGADFNVLTLEIASDGAHLAFQTNAADRRMVPADESRATLRILDLENGVARTLVPRLGGPTSCSYAFSPDGRTLAFFAPGDLDYRKFRRLATFDVSSGRQQTWTEKADVHVRAFFWSEAADALFFTVVAGVNRPWFALRFADGSVTRVSDEAGVHSGRYVAAAKSFITVYSNSRQPDEIFTATASTIADRTRWVRLSRANERLASLPVADVRVLRWPSGDGREIEGLLFEPLGYRRGQRYPMIVQVNGANNLYPSYYQSYAHQLAGRGYLVLQVNHRALGSTGYGEAFKLETYPPNAVLDHATQDILTGISALVKDGVADGDRVGLMGWSIGGFTANWLMTRTSQFKAISTGAGNADMVAAYGQIDQYRYYYRNSWGGSAFRSWDFYTSLSPLRFMERAATPTLIHVGEHDDGVTLQCRETYNALQEFGVPVEMLVHVGQSHNLQAPQSLLAKMLADVSWFEQWIRGGPSWLGWQADFDSIVRGR